MSITRLAPCRPAATPKPRRSGSHPPLTPPMPPSRRTPHSTPSIPSVPPSPPAATTVFFNTKVAGAMLIGRFIFVIPLLAVAGSLAQKKLLAPSAGTFPTNRRLFVGLLVGVVLIIGGLTYFPAISLGPAVEQVAMNQGKLYPGP